MRYRPFQEQALAGPIPHKKSATFWVALLLVRDSVGNGKYEGGETWGKVCEECKCLDVSMLQGVKL